MSMLKDYTSSKAMIDFNNNPKPLPYILISSGSSHSATFTEAMGHDPVPVQQAISTVMVMNASIGKMTEARDNLLLLIEEAVKEGKDDGHSL
ncbi:hypothetical protein ACET9R_18840 [Aeromonas veronii]|uniref:hypothetical protein n=1 Tax=Aeromonas veronii TaxID=654 RepID=UPI0038DC202A